MANTVAKATLYTEIMDGVIEAGLTSAPLTAEANSIQYNGGSTVEIAKMSTGGFGDYNRATGYPDGAAVLSWESHSITQDRGVKFTVDAMDQDETKQTLSSTKLIAEFSKVHSIPEVDSYRYSKIFSSIVDDATVRYSYYAPVVATVLGQIQSDIGDIQDVIGEQEPLVCFISGQAYKVLTASTQLSKEIMAQEPGKKSIDGRLLGLDGVELIVVPSARMKTEYAFSATNGFAAKAWARDMNYIIMAKSSAVGFVKHNKLKVFSADENQSADGELIQARMNHDLWVYENKHNAIFVSLKTATIAGFSAAELSTTGATNVTYTIATYASRDTGHKFYYFDGGSAAAKTVPACYDELTMTGYVEITSASPVSDVVTSGYYGTVIELDENSRVIRFGSIKAA